MARLSSLPVELLYIICKYADSSAKLNLQLVSRIFREILAPEVWQRAVFDFRCFSTSRYNQHLVEETVYDDHELVKISSDIVPQMRFSDLDLAKLCKAILKGQCKEVLKCIRHLVVILPREFQQRAKEKKIKPKVRKLKKLHSLQVALWFLENIITPAFFTNIETLEVVSVETFDSSLFHPSMLLSKFNCQKKTIMLDSWELDTRKDNYDLARLNRVKIGLNEFSQHIENLHDLVPDSITHLTIYRTAQKRMIIPEVKESIRKLTNLRSLSLQGVEFPFHSGSWLPKSVEHLEFTYNATLSGTFHNVKTLILNSVTGAPFERLHFPDIENLSIDCRRYPLVDFGDNMRVYKQLQVSHLEFECLNTLLGNTKITHTLVAAGVDVEGELKLQIKQLNQVPRVVLGTKGFWDPKKLRPVLHHLGRCSSEIYIYGGTHLRHALKKLAAQGERIPEDCRNLSFVTSQMMTAPPMPEPLLRGYKVC